MLLRHQDVLGGVGGPAVRWNGVPATLAIALVIVLVIALSGCAASDLRYTEQEAVASNTVPQYARVTVFRTESAQYSGRSATLSIDGKEVGAIEVGFKTFDVTAGSHVLFAGRWDSPGTCKLQIEVVGGSAYYYEVASRIATPGTRNFTTTLPGAIVGALGIIGALISGAVGIVQILAGPGGEFDEACAIVSVEENIALPRLDPLSKSK